MGMLVNGDNPLDYHHSLASPLSIEKTASGGGGENCRCDGVGANELDSEGKSENEVTMAVTQMRMMMWKLMWPLTRSRLKEM